MCEEDMREEDLDQHTNGQQHNRHIQQYSFGDISLHSIHNVNDIHLKNILRNKVKKT